MREREVSVMTTTKKPFRERAFRGGKMEDMIITLRDTAENFKEKANAEKDNQMKLMYQSQASAFEQVANEMIYKFRYNK
jgi:hypothetical protein